MVVRSRAEMPVWQMPQVWVALAAVGLGSVALGVVGAECVGDAVGLSAAGGGGVFWDAILEVAAAS